MRPEVISISQDFSSMGWQLFGPPNMFSKSNRIFYIASLFCFAFHVEIKKFPQENASNSLCQSWLKQFHDLKFVLQLIWGRNKPISLNEAYLNIHIFLKK